MTNQKTIDLLQKLGLTFYGAKAYATLTTTGTTTPSILVTEAEIPRSRIYEVISRSGWRSRRGGPSGSHSFVHAKSWTSGGPCWTRTSISCPTSSRWTWRNACRTKTRKWASSAASIISPWRQSTWWDARRGRSFLSASCIFQRISSRLKNKCWARSEEMSPSGYWPTGPSSSRMESWTC